MGKRWLLAGLLSFVSVAAGAQRFMRMEEKAFNFGAKVGFNATLPIVNGLEVDGNTVKAFHVQYRVGYLAALFCRINVERFFIQPSLAWHHAEGEVYFSLPEAEGDAATNPTYDASANSLAFQSRSLEVPVMVGYHLVRQGPYGLSLMIGPKLKYRYKASYDAHIAGSYSTFPHHDDPFGVNLSTGVGVSIGRLFFDVIYEFGLSQTVWNHEEEEVLPASFPHTVRIDKRTNVMSFSLGFLF